LTYCVHVNKQLAQLIEKRVLELIELFFARR